MSSGNTDSRNFPTIVAVLHGNKMERITALEHIIAAHWKPLYKYIRLQYRIPPTEACTITQNFLEQFEEAAFFAKFDPARQPLREFIRQKLDVFVPIPGARKSADPAPALDFTGAEEEFNVDQAGPGQSAAEYYNNEWVRSLLTLAVEELHTTFAAEGKNQDFSLFMKLDLQDRSGTGRVGLEEIAAELSMPLSDALTSLAKTRQRLQNILMDLIRSFTSSDAEFRREARTFFRA
jgi:hypothetical protein